MIIFVLCAGFAFAAAIRFGSMTVVAAAALPIQASAARQTASRLIVFAKRPREENAYGAYFCWHRR
jgi:hypothetical protein